MIKISFPSKDFARAFAIVGKQVARKSVMPILENVLLRFDQERRVFQMMASDSESWLTIDVPFITAMDGDSQQPFDAVVLPYVTLKDALATLPSVPCTAVIDDGKITVEHSDGHFSLPVQDSMEFPMPVGVITEESPLPRDSEPVCRFTVSTDWLLPVMSDARVSVAADPLRPVLNTECIDVFCDKIVVVSSDGHLLFKSQHDTGAGSGFLDYHSFAANESAKLLVPGNIIDTVITAFSSAEEVTITADDKRIQFSAEGACLVCRSVEGRYPNYESVIPKDNPFIVTVNRNSLRSSLRRLNIFASESSNMVVLHRQGNTLTLEADDIDFSLNSCESITIQGDTQMPENTKFGFKIATLIALSGVIGTENVVLCLADPTRPMLLKEEDSNSQLTLLAMPMLVS